MQNERKRVEKYSPFFWEKVGKCFLNKEKKEFN